MAFDDANAITCPSGDHVGLANPLAATSRTRLEPSAFITVITLELQVEKAQGHSTWAIRLPSGDQAG